MGHRSAQLRVELVDDQALVREALGALVQRAAGMELVAVAGSVAEAVRCAEEFHPDIVLMDVLPDTGVFEGASEITRRSPHTKVVLLDEASSDTHVRETLRIRAAGYLTKQQPFGQIEAALRQVAGGDRVFAPEVASRLTMSPEGVRLSVKDKDNPVARLTAREMDVLIYLAQGYSVKRCAEALGIGASTVGNHKSRLMKKLNVHKAVELTHLAMHEGLISLGGNSASPATSRSYDLHSLN